MIRKRQTDQFLADRLPLFMKGLKKIEDLRTLHKEGVGG